MKHKFHNSPIDPSETIPFYRGRLHVFFNRLNLNYYPFCLSAPTIIRILRKSKYT